MTMEITDNLFEWLQFCFECLDSGNEDSIPQNFCYKSKRGKITDDYVDRIIATIDREFERELIRSPDYHMNHSGTLTPPEFRRLGKAARRAVVEGIDRALGYEEVK